MASRDPSYRAYLLRCWQEGRTASGGTSGWRFSVEEVLRPRRRWGFGGLASLLAFLEIELGSAVAGPIDGSQEGDRRAAQPGHDKKGETRMVFQNCTQFATENPLCYLATTEDDQPRVRPILLWFADEGGFTFCGLGPKKVWAQIEANPKLEPSSPMFPRTRSTPTSGSGRPAAS